MSSDSLQNDMTVDASVILRKTKSLRDTLSKLSSNLYELRADVSIEVLPVSLRETLQKCLEETDSAIAKVGDVTEQVEINQEAILNESVTELRGTLAELDLSVNRIVESLSKITDFLRQQILSRIFRSVVVLVFVEAIVWLLLFMYWGAAKSSSSFLLFTLILLPQIVFAYMLVLWRGVEQIRLYRAGVTHKKEM